MSSISWMSTGATCTSGRSTSRMPGSRSAPFASFSICSAWEESDDMYPILFEIGGFPVYTYGVLLAAAYLLGLQFALVRARARNLDANRVMDLGIWIIVSALIGAKLLLLIVDFDTFRN